MKIYVSTTVNKKNDFFSTALALLNEGFKNIELSAGKYIPNWRLQLEILSNNANLMLHNYFPPPEVPFVINLASEKSEIRLKSIAFFLESLEISGSIGSKYLGIHSGFLLDPDPKELGSAISKKRKLKYIHAQENFISAVNQLAQKARIEGVKLLIENNVLTRENLELHGENILLAVTPDEIIEIFDQLDNQVGLLLDVGHLNVSSNTLGFDRVDALQLLNKYVEGYHISENNGDSDQHDFISNQSWFLEHLDSKKSFSTLEIHSTNYENLKVSEKILRNYCG